MSKKSPRKTGQREFDFFFLVVMAVFSALTLLTASSLAKNNKEIARRRELIKEQQAFDLAQLELANPQPTATPPKYKNPTTK